MKCSKQLSPVTPCEIQEIFYRLFGKLRIAIVNYMSTLIHYYEKTSPI